MAQFKRRTYLTVSVDDLRRLLSEELCTSYGLFAGMSVTSLRAVDGGDFELCVSPPVAGVGGGKPTIIVEAKKSAKSA